MNNPEFLNFPDDDITRRCSWVAGFGRVDEDGREER